MDTPATLRKYPASSLLNAKARQPPLASGASLCLALSDAPHLAPTPSKIGFMPGREGVIAREIVASRV